MKVLSHPYRFIDIPWIYLTTGKDWKEVTQDRSVHIPYESIIEIEKSKLPRGTATVAFKVENRIGLISLPLISNNAQRLMRDIPELVKDQDLVSDLKTFVSQSLTFRMLFFAIIFSIFLRIGVALPKPMSTLLMFLAVIFFTIALVTYPILYYFKYKKKLTLWISYRIVSLEVIFIFLISFTFINNSAIVFLKYAFKRIISGW